MEKYNIALLGQWEYWEKRDRGNGNAGMDVGNEEKETGWRNNAFLSKRKWRIK